MLTNLEQLDWATPWGALLLLVPLALAGMAYRRRAKLAAWADPHLQPWAVAAKGEGERRNGRRLAAWLAWGLLALAAAGPRLPLEETVDKRSGPARHVVSVMVALDVSASMAAADIAPDRLTRARLELADLTKRLSGERLGLVLYAGEAGLLLPPTDDASLFDRALSQAGPELIEAQGSDVAAALELAAQKLGSEKIKRRAVLLVTDAEASTGRLQKLRAMQQRNSRPPAFRFMCWWRPVLRALRFPCLTAVMPSATACRSPAGRRWMAMPNSRA
jgi:Ca-activated chloride channel family protein